MDSKRRMPSAGTVVAVIALVVALAGTAIAAVGLNHKQKRQVRSIARSQVNGTVKRVFKILPITPNGASIPIVARPAGFQIRVSCSQDHVNAYVADPRDVTVDGHSHIGNEARGTDDDLQLTTQNGNHQASFAITTKSGQVASGNLAFDYPGGAGIFDGDTSHCVVYGHILVN